MENECYMFERCMLIIYSDMNDARSIMPEYLSVQLRNLRDVEILGILPNCEDLYSPVCGNAIETWKRYLFINNINARSVDFINGENLEMDLFRALVN